jgi:hydroxymethylpyrimidine pyrophosphatase-like HAD family hydrolase
MGENDIPMLEAAGIGIAVENADNVCKQHADFVTEHNNDNDGVARFLEEQAWQR